MNRIGKLARAGLTGSPRAPGGQARRAPTPDNAPARKGSWRGVAVLSVVLLGGFAAFTMMSGDEGPAAPASAPAATAGDSAAGTAATAAGRAAATGAQNQPAGAHAANLQAANLQAANAREASATDARPPEPGAQPEKSPGAGWVAASEEQPAFRLAPLPQLPGTATLRGLMAMAGMVEGVRHASGGGRDDALIIGDPGQAGPLLRLSLYRPGSEPQPGGSFFVDVARRAGETGMWVERFAPLPALETRLGPVDIAVARLGGQAGARSCVTFKQMRAQPDLRLSGWVCLDGDAPPAPEAAACIIDAVRWQREQDEPQIAALFAASAATTSACAPPAAGDLTSSIRPADATRR